MSFFTATGLRRIIACVVTGQYTGVSGKHTDGTLGFGSRVEAYAMAMLSLVKAHQSRAVINLLSSIHCCE